MLVGGTGTGKTHLAIAIARACIRSGARARFFNTTDLVNRLETESRQGRAGKLAEHLARLDLVVLDELGYLPSPRPEGSCSSISSRSSTRPRRSSSPPTLPSGNGPRSSRREDDDGIARPSHASLRNRRNRGTTAGASRTAPEHLTRSSPACAAAARLRNPGQLRRGGRYPLKRETAVPYCAPITGPGVKAD